jgi:hypothetical protein
MNETSLEKDLSHLSIVGGILLKILHCSKYDLVCDGPLVLF